MDEEEDDDKVVRQREVVVDAGDTSTSDTQEEQPPPESDSQTVECRFFGQSEWVQADAEQKAFIQECDRAAGRAVSSSPSAKEADAKEAPQERATQPEPQPQPAALPEPQPKASPPGGDVDCGDFNPRSAAQAYLLPGDPYDLDRDNDGIACE